MKSTSNINLKLNVAKLKTTAQYLKVCIIEIMMTERDKRVLFLY